MRQALEDNAAAVIFAHNHPSGVAEPSQADISLTRRLKEALGLVDIRVLDHMVIGHGEEYRWLNEVDVTGSPPENWTFQQFFALAGQFWYKRLSGGVWQQRSV